MKAALTPVDSLQMSAAPSSATHSSVVMERPTAYRCSRCRQTGHTLPTCPYASPVPTPLEAPSPPVLRISETVPRPVGRVETTRRPRIVETPPSKLDLFRIWLIENTAADKATVKHMTVKQLFKHLELYFQMEKIALDIRALDASVMADAEGLEGARFISHMP